MLLVLAFVLLGCSSAPKKDSTFASKGKSKGIYHKPLNVEGK